MDNAIYKDWQSGTSIFRLSLKYNMDAKVIKRILEKFGYERYCPICNKPFRVGNLNNRYCSVKCRESKPSTKPVKKDKPQLDKMVAKLRQKGIKYSDWQRQKTLEMLKGA